MKARTIALALALLISAPALFAAEETKPEGAAAGMPSAEDMKKWEQAMTPGKAHQHLAKLAGDWTFTNTMWMAPGAPPQTSTGTMHGETILGGRFVHHTWKGNFMGMPFEGHGYDGYDNVTKTFVNTWMDNMSTGLMPGTGTCNESMSVCTYTATMSDPMSGKQTTSRSVITWLDDNSFKNEMFGPGPDGKEMKMMEIVATRKK